MSRCCGLKPVLMVYLVDISEYHILEMAVQNQLESGHSTYFPARFSPKKHAVGIAGSND
jgi:hypothetical protein